MYVALKNILLLNQTNVFLRELTALVASFRMLRIAVENLDQNRHKRSIPLRKDEFGQLSDHRTAKERGQPGYIAAELAANFSGPFIIGDGKIYRGFHNPPLLKGQKYDIIFGMVLTVGEVGRRFPIWNLLYNRRRCERSDQNTS
jgi:hypothetical protein